MTKRFGEAHIKASSEALAPLTDERNTFLKSCINASTASEAIPCLKQRVDLLINFRLSNLNSANSAVITTCIVFQKSPNSTSMENDAWRRLF